ncbi:MAG TPA: glycerophosphoryl diester phosphodiesterase membrane domain-containing protein [Terracidiphilus sp.]|nr:glycerophosphoryl diester phosphodiesterase membrane domain-containing protein [Terracidiphilus sp.]
MAGACGLNPNNVMNPILRPMTLGEILDRAFEIYRRRLWLFVTVGALPAALILALRSADVAWWHTDYLVNKLAPDEVTDSGLVAWRFVVSYGYSHILSFLLALFFPALLRLTWCEIFGESTTVVAALRFALARWRTYLWLAALLLIATMILPETIAFGVFFGTGTLEDKLNLIGEPPSIPAIVILLAEIPAGFALMLWAKACLAYSIPAASFEQLAGIKALRRSWKLTKGSRRRIVVAWLTVSVCNWVLSWAAAYALRWVVYFLYRVGHFQWVGQHATSEAALVLYAIIEAFVLPIYAIAVTLLYYDQRVRKEGYDLEVMMQNAGLAEPETIEAGKPDAAGGEAPSRWARVPSDSWDRR